MSRFVPVTKPPYNLPMPKYLLPILLTLLTLAACTPKPPPAAPTATHTAVPLPTATPSPTATAIATAVPLPTHTAAPTPTPTPAYPVYTGPPLAQNRLGIQLHLRDENQRDLFHHLQQLGVGWVKVQISWKLYEPEPGNCHTERFAELDAFVRQANALGINILLSVSKAPEWSRPTTEMDGPPADFALYTQFMRNLAQRYQGQVAAYELWNEPNLQREWNGRPLSGSDFVTLIQAGAAGVRATDPAALLIAGAPATTGINDRLTAIDDRVFLQEMLDAGVTAHVDAIAAHPYGWANPPDSTISQPDPAIPSHNNHPSFFFRDTLADYRTLLDQSGSSLPIWVTEFGWGSFENIAPAPPPGVEFMADVSEWQQAIYTLRALELAQTDPQLGPLILWNLNFGHLLGTEFSESGYGILRPDGTERPLYHTLATAPKE